MWEALAFEHYGEAGLHNPLKGFKSDTPRWKQTHDLIPIGLAWRSIFREDERRKAN